MKLIGIIIAVIGVFLRMGTNNADMHMIGIGAMVVGLLMLFGFKGIKWVVKQLWICSRADVDRQLKL